MQKQMNDIDENDPFGLRPIWDSFLEVYKCFAEICKRNGLRHFITDGNAIGVVRHNGHFIPWDDDLDVSMPYPDYLKFLEICTNELPPHLKIVNWRNTPEFTMQFSKLQDVRKEKILQIEKQTGRTLSNGIFIDIFPIYGCREGAFWKMYVKFKHCIVSCIERYRIRKFCRETLKGRIAWFIGFIMSVFAPRLVRRDDFTAYYAKELAKVPYGKTRLTGCAELVNSFRRYYPLACWGDGNKLVDFEGIQVPVPQDCHAYLSIRYPGYMQLPPKENQHPTHDYGVHCPWWLGPTKQR